MKKALLLGKFMPLHLGHIALIDFGLANADIVDIAVCVHKNEPIDGQLRYNWVNDYYKNNQQVNVHLVEYNEDELSSSSETSVDASIKWTDYLKQMFPATNVFISSEPYGKLVATHWGIDHLLFDEQRTRVPIAASDILKQPFVHWQYLPDIVKSYFVKKICIVGAESTGKSTLTERLAKHYQTAFVPEVARDIVDTTQSCTLQDLHTIAAAHAKAIIDTLPLVNKLLFVDTDITITKSYARFLFDAALQTEDWIEEANRFDLYLFLETDSPFVQDGTRLEEEDREKLNTSHKKEFAGQGIAYHILTGDWEQRFLNAVKMIDKTFLKNKQ
ncbi:MAG: AAA family ATPase [Chitinophagaceae bacterium]